MTKITLEGAVLNVSTKSLFSTKTVSLPIDSLRLVYLFLPKSFQWRIVQTNVQYRYINLHTLSEESFLELSKLLLKQDSYNLERTQIVLKDFSDQEVTMSLKELAADQINIFPQFAQYRSMLREKLANWLRGDPQVKFGLNMIISATGVGYPNKSYWMPWNALDKFTMFSTGSATIFNFIPTKASGLKQFGAGGIPIAQTQSWLAELEFWRALGQPKAEGVAD
jgi:hypothetical protein